MPRGEGRGECRGGHTKGLDRRPRLGCAAPPEWQNILYRIQNTRSVRGLNSGNRRATMYSEPRSCPRTDRSSMAPLRSLGRARASGVGPEGGDAKVEFSVEKLHASIAPAVLLALVGLVRISLIAIRRRRR